MAYLASGPALLQGGGGRQEQLSIMQSMLACSRQLSISHIVDHHDTSHYSHDALLSPGAPNPQFNLFLPNTET